MVEPALSAAIPDEGKRLKKKTLPVSGQACWVFLHEDKAALLVERSDPNFRGRIDPSSPA